MRTCVPLLPLLCLALGVWAPAARAEVYQCVDAGGALLLTDSPCPSGYQTRFVAREVQPKAPVSATAKPPPVPQSTAKSEAQLLASAQAEAALLRVQLETERLRLELVQEQLKLADRQLDAQAEPTTVGYSVVGPVLVPALVRHPHKHGKPGRPCVDCRPRVLDDTVKVVARDRWSDCGMFGCTPRITHAPWDDAARARDTGVKRTGISDVPPRRAARPATGARALP